MNVRGPEAARRGLPRAGGARPAAGANRPGLGGSSPGGEPTTCSSIWLWVVDSRRKLSYPHAWLHPPSSGVGFGGGATAAARFRVGFGDGITTVAQIGTGVSVTATDGRGSRWWPVRARDGVLECWFDAHGPVPVPTPELRPRPAAGG